MRTVPYLTFAGNCREAMNFYKKCLGAQLQIQTVGQTTRSGKMPVKMKECILLATLSKGQTLLTASDMVADEGLLGGNNMAITLFLNSEEEIKTCYAKLAKGAIVKQALGITHWNALFGNLTDKYGHHWLLYYDRNNYIKK